MREASLLLGLDVGTTAVKAVLVDGEGQACGSSRVPTPFRGGEMAPAHLLTAVARAIGRLGGLRRVAAVGIAGLAESGTMLDNAGQPLAPIIAWNDPRGGEVVDRLRRQLGDDLDRAIGQRLRTVSSVAKLGWLLDRGVEPAAHWLGVPELVGHAVTGNRVTEFSLAARTGAYHVGERRYLTEVAALLGARGGVGTDVFAPVAAAGSDMGRINAAGAGWSGLPAGIPITVAGHDHLVGRTGAGVGPLDVANSVGTAETVVAALPDGPLPDMDVAIAERVAVTLLPGGTGRALLASAARAGLVLAAVASALGTPVEELDHRATAAAGHRPLVDRVDPAGGDGIIEAALAGRSLPLDPDEPPEVTYARVVVALAARTWDAVDRLERVAGAQWVAGGGLVVYGGGSRSRAWLDAKAQARPTVAVWRSRAEEAVARGAALYAGVAAGWWPSAEGAPRFPLERVSFGHEVPSNG